MKEAYKNKKVLITGGLGFIGSNLAIALVEAGADVLLVDSMMPSYGGNTFNIEPIKDKVQVNYSDIRDPYSLHFLVQDKDIIFNLAGTLSHVDSMSDPMTDLDINCRAQLNLLEVLRQENPSARVVFAGTRNQYGRALYTPVDEDHPQDPTDINGINNIAAEKYHLLYAKIYGMQTVSLRMTNTYGPRHQMKHSRQGVLNWFIRQVLDGETVELYGDGTQIRDVTYITDVVQALLLVGESDSGWGEAYNLGGFPVSLIDFVSEIIAVAGKGAKTVRPFPNDRKKIEIGDYRASWEKIHREYGWKPAVPVKAGIEKTVRYYMKHKKMYW